jgi:hypothetical protein
MKIRQFVNVVPKAIRTGAVMLVACGALTGLVLGFFWRSISHLPYDPIAIMGKVVLGLGVGLLLGSLVATWLLCLGYVYGDARRRAMRPVLWVLVAALFPHLLGFLLYFVMRQPIASTCTHCGQTVPLYQRFCSWCGNPQPAAVSSDVRLAADQC